MADVPVIIWFRNALRLADHAALHAAIGTKRPVLPVFVLDDAATGAWKSGSASRWWLHHSLTSLAHDLRARGARIDSASRHDASRAAGVAERDGSGLRLRRPGR